MVIPLVRPGHLIPPGQTWSYHPNWSDLVIPTPPPPSQTWSYHPPVRPGPLPRWSDLVTPHPLLRPGHTPCSDLVTPSPPPPPVRPGHANPPVRPPHITPQSDLVTPHPLLRPGHTPCSDLVTPPPRSDLVMLTPRSDLVTPPGTENKAIRSTCGRYASYWNAFLFKLQLILHMKVLLKFQTN